jgi:DNA mismatch repair ATPase MutL
MDTVAVTDQKEKEDKFVATVAIKTASKDKIILDENTSNNLVKKLLLLPDAFVGPKGKSVAIKISRVDMEKKFSRR